MKTQTRTQTRTQMPIQMANKIRPMEETIIIMAILMVQEEVETETQPKQSKQQQPATAKLATIEPPYDRQRIQRLSSRNKHSDGDVLQKELGKL